MPSTVTTNSASVALRLGAVSPNSGLSGVIGCITVQLSENTGVRRMAFAADGTLRDLGVTTTGEKLSDIVGAIGVQP